MKSRAHGLHKPSSDEHATRQAASLRSRRRLEGRTGCLFSCLYNTLSSHLFPDKHDHHRTLATIGGQNIPTQDKSGQHRTNATYGRSKALCMYKAGKKRARAETSGNMR